MNMKNLIFCNVSLQVRQWTAEASKPFLHKNPSPSPCYECVWAAIGGSPGAGPDEGRCPSVPLDPPPFLPLLSPSRTGPAGRPPGAPPGVLGPAVTWGLLCIDFSSPTTARSPLFKSQDNPRRERNRLRIELKRFKIKVIILTMTILNLFKTFFKCSIE